MLISHCSQTHTIITNMLRHADNTAALTTLDQEEGAVIDNLREVSSDQELLEHGAKGRSQGLSCP